MGDEDRQLKYINVGMEFTNKVAAKLLETLDDDDKDQQMDVLRTIMKDYIKMEHEYNVSKDVLAKLKKGLEVENADMDRDIDAEYRSNLKAELEKNELTQGKISGDHRLRNLESIASGSGASEATGDDDDVVMTDDTQTFIDPWTRKNITDDPITNRKCGHTYEKAIVMKFLEKYAKAKKPLKCPVVGCTNNNITKADLYNDAAIRKKIFSQNRSRR